MDERSVPDLLRMAEKRRGNLRVKERARHRPYLAQKNLDVLPACVEKLHRALVFEKRGDHGKIIHREGVDDRDLVVGRHLKQAELRVVGGLSEELGIDGEHLGARDAFDERFEARLVG